MGTVTGPMAKPRPCSRNMDCTPDAASSPKAEPPDNTSASTLSTEFLGDSSSVSRVPGPPPITWTLAIVGSSQRTTVTPDFRFDEAALPTVNPAISLIEFLGPGLIVICHRLERFSIPLIEREMVVDIATLGTEFYVTQYRFKNPGLQCVYGFFARVLNCL